jgi:hypothetical protein
MRSYSFAIPGDPGTRCHWAKRIFEEVEDKISIFPIGIQPLHADEGYLLLSDYIKRLVNVYYYNITIF